MKKWIDDDIIRLAMVIGIIIMAVKGIEGWGVLVLLLLIF